MKMETFYVVMRADAASTVNVRHATETEAREEAERLCQKMGKPFVMLQAIACVEIAQFRIRWKNIDDVPTTDSLIDDVLMTDSSKVHIG
jgi:hypothetical protein